MANGYPIDLKLGFNGVLPETWATASTAWDVREYSSVRVQFDGAPTTPYQPQWSLDGSDFYNTPAYDRAGNRYDTITAAGIYLFPGNCYLKFGAGAGSILTRGASA